MTIRILFLSLATVAMAGEGIRPGVIEPEDLKEYASLSGPRKRIVDKSLELAAKDTWLRYTFGSADPASGGLDCSGAVYHILQEAGFEPPRSSAAQFIWVRDAKALTEVPSTETTLKSAVFTKLMPGDLLFWSGTYEPKDGREVPVSHVQIFLGHEKETGQAVMVGASDGRTYRGIKRDGYGVFDFKLPRPESKGVFLGFGLPQDPE
ncbi:C40 family peptidase [Luteolibacter luteus]|uniref:Peptidoglycan endopeptidase n=1 Tax=Luteolibacter luteus TaxID=2728835 RepID=A0A858RHR3_9BACT|nr:NlpC/P60 family protein [Luteolibacter luteus]QJE96372.1 peptidoglycan endopeptidase [Luteolibacter luteus]